MFNIRSSSSTRIQKVSYIKKFWRKKDFKKFLSFFSKLQKLYLHSHKSLLWIFSNNWFNDYSRILLCYKFPIPCFPLVDLNYSQYIKIKSTVALIKVVGFIMVNRARHLYSFFVHNFVLDWDIDFKFCII